MNRLTSLIITAVVIILWVACDVQRDPCLQPKNVTLRARFLRPADTGTQFLDTTLPHPVYGVLDSPFHFSIPSGSSVLQFFLSPLADSTKYIIVPDSANPIVDTIAFYYQRQLQFLSNACGYTYYFTITGVTSTRHSIDSVVLNNASVTSNANVDHVKIYF